MVTSEELAEKRANGELSSFVQAVESGDEGAILDFSTGSITGSQYSQRALVLDEERPIVMRDEVGGREESTIGQATGRVPFEPVGIGRPLAVEIRQVYTGTYGQTFLGRGTGILVTSAVRNAATFNAAPRAVNFLKTGAKPFQRFQGPSAVEDGTRLVYYSPALTEGSLQLRLEAAFDDYDPAMLEAMSGAMKTAAGLPLFAATSVAIGPYAAPAAVLLLAGSVATKIAGDVARGVFDREAEFTADIPLDVARPGEEPLSAGFKLVTEVEVSEAWRKEHPVGLDGIVRDHDGSEYTGDTPFMVISVDGHQNADYEGFSATAASAALLKQYYGVGEKQAQPLSALVEGLGLYNDLKYRDEADDLKKQIDAYKGDAAGLAELELKRDAAIKNINNTLLRP